MSKSIEFNSFSLQDSNFRTRDIIYRNLPNKAIDLELKARRDGFVVTNTYFTEKNITISGSLTRDTEANLKTSLDSMKESLYTDEANLDIGDGGTTIRWVCSVASISVPEEHYHITRVPYEISFKCQPFGISTSSTNDSKTITQASPSPYTNTFDPTGSAPPLPTLKWTCSGAPTSAITQIAFTNSTTGQTITVGSLSLDANGDYLEIDCDNMTVNVSYDGGAETAVDYSGVFPDFVTGSNSYSLSITGGGATFTIDQDIDYYAQYL